MIGALLGLNDDLNEPWPSQSERRRVLQGHSGPDRPGRGQVPGPMVEGPRDHEAPRRHLRDRRVGRRGDAGPGARRGADRRRAAASRRSPCGRGSPASVVRAAVEVERSMGEPRFQVRRDGDRVVVALSQDLAGYAFRLGDLADKLAAEDPLVPPQRVLQRLREVSPPEWCSRARGLSPDPARGGGFVSSRALQPAGALSPRGWMPARALKLSQGALYGVASLTVPEIRERVRSRYPEAAQLPDPPVLDVLAGRGGIRVPAGPRRSRASAATCAGSAIRSRCRAGASPRCVSRRGWPRMTGWKSPPRWPTPASSRNGSGTASRKGRSTRCS